MKDLLIILDPAHGQDVAGKRSPDGEHREYRWSRERCASLWKKLSDLGYRVEYTNTTENEIGLTKRANNANNFINSWKGKSILLSLHNDAYTDNWNSAHGYSVYTTKGHTNSDILAERLMNEFAKTFPELTARVDMTDGDKDKEENFTVIYKSICPSVLIEWLFQTNKEEVELLKDSDYNEKYENCIIRVIEGWN